MGKGLKGKSYGVEIREGLRGGERLRGGKRGRDEKKGKKVKGWKRGRVKGWKKECTMGWKRETGYWMVKGEGLMGGKMGARVKGW